MSKFDIAPSHYIDRSHINAVEKAIEELQHIADNLADEGIRDELLPFEEDIVRLLEVKAFLKERLGTVLFHIPN